MIIILASMKPELEFIEKYNHTGTDKLGVFTYERYSHNGIDFACSACGTGKVTAAMCAQVGIEKYKPTLVLNTGTSGKISKSVKSKDIIVATDTVQYDYDLTPFGYKKGELAELKTVEMLCDEKFVNIAKQVAKDYTNVHFGRVCTADMVVVDEEKIEEISTEFGGLCCEMEAGAIAQCATMYNVPFAFIKGISDGDEEVENREEEFRSNIEATAKSNAELIFKILEQY